MSLNFTIFAQNNTDDYVKQACLCAMSIKYTNPNSDICLITNDAVEEKYKKLFVEIVPIPWGDMVRSESWKVANRWKIYHATPFKNTVVIDSDMLFLSKLDHWCSFFDNRDLYFVSQVKNYRNKIVKSDYYRKAFTENQLPNLYSGLHYIKKSEFSHEFYKVLELVMKNWVKFYNLYPSISKHQKVLSVDVSAAIAAKILDCESDITSNDGVITFTHMKYHCQEWKYKMGTKWQDRVGVYLDSNLDLKIGSYKQHGIFHYTEKDFVNESIIQKYEKAIGL